MVAIAGLFLACFLVPGDRFAGLFLTDHWLAEGRFSMFFYPSTGPGFSFEQNLAVF
jgi:hypothetical protein